MNIPPITDPFAKHWDQPDDMTSVVFDDKHVLLSHEQFIGLRDYSRSTPSGVYSGKCWKWKGTFSGWFLCWFGEELEFPVGAIARYSREIIIV